MFSVETWLRLFLAASGLAAGALFDIRERRYMGFIMFAATVLSTISILAVEAGASPVIGLIVFYLSSGFFVTFFTTTFLQLAPRMRTPQLWAGMGRAANNLCTFTVSGVSMMLTQSGIAAVMIAPLILFCWSALHSWAPGCFACRRRSGNARPSRRALPPLPRRHLRRCRPSSSAEAD